MTPAVMTPAIAGEHCRADAVQFWTMFSVTILLQPRNNRAVRVNALRDGRADAAVASEHPHKA